MFQDIQFVSRQVAEGINPCLDNRWALISIREVGDKPANLSGRWSHKMCIEFDDTDDAEDPNVFSAEDAKRIIDFLDTCKANGVTHLFVHCLAGISRSAAVAKFAADYVGCDLFNLRFGSYSLYNKWVFSKLVNVANGWEG